MRFKYIILFIVFFLVGCNTLQLRLPRAKINNNDKIETEINKPEINKGEINKPKIRVPQIRKPNIKWRNKKVEQKEVDQIKQNAEDYLARNANEKTGQPTNEERKERFDDLHDVNNQKQTPKINEVAQINESKKPTLFDTIFTWIGACGVCAVFWTGVYFIAKNLLSK